MIQCTLYNAHVLLPIFTRCNNAHRIHTNSVGGSRPSFSSLHTESSRRSLLSHRYQHNSIISVRRHSLSNENFDENTDSIQEQKFAQAVLLCFLACQNRSLFAAKCLVETLVEVYRHGYTIDDIKLSVTLMTLTTADPFKPIMQDIFLAWCAIVFMTLRTVGVPLHPYGEARLQKKGKKEQAEDELRMTPGLEAFVKTCLNRFLSGTDIFRLQLQQGMQRSIESEGDAQGESPAVHVLQQNTRLAIITLEVVRSMKLPTTVALTASEYGEDKQEDDGSDIKDDDTDETVSSQGGGDKNATDDELPMQPSIGFVSGYLLGASQPVVDLQGEERAKAVRGGAVRLMIAFNGAALGYIRPARSFVEEALACYSAGWTADELFTSLNDEEFAQSGGLVRFGVAQFPGKKDVSATLFARWLSIVYITFAQMAVAFPGAQERVGWAWVCSLGSEDSGESPAALEAHGLSEFVSNTLRLAAQSDEESGGDEEMREHGGPKHWEDRKRAGSMAGRGSESVSNTADDAIMDSDISGSSSTQGFTPIGFEDPELLKTSPFTLVLSQQLSLVRLTRLAVINKMQEREALASSGGV